MRCPNRAQYRPGPLQLLYMHAALLQAGFAFLVKTPWLLVNVLLVCTSYILSFASSLQACVSVVLNKIASAMTLQQLSSLSPDESSNHSTMMSQLAALGGHVHGCLQRRRKLSTLLVLHVKCGCL